jgi:hypothetical protein
MKNGQDGKTAAGLFWRAAGRFPAAFVLAAVCAACLCGMDDKERVYGMAVACLVMPMLAWAGLSVALGLCGERWGWKRWVHLSLQVAVLLGAAASISEELLGSVQAGPFRQPTSSPRDTYFWTSRLLGALGTWLLAGWALAGRQARPEDAAPRAAVAAATGGAAFAGLALGLNAIGLVATELFDLPSSVGGWAFRLTAGPAMALGGWLAVALATREEPFEMPRAWRLLLRWVAVPVGLAFTGILLAYFAVCVARLDLPRGQIVWFASAAAGIWMALHLVLAGDPGRFIRVCVRWGGLAILPLTALQFVALGIRIGEYGLTPARLGGLLLASWIALFCIAAAVRPSATARWGFAAAGVLALLAGLSPWNISDMGIAAQVRRLDAFRARRDAGETFDSATKRAIWGTWKYASDYAFLDGHWRRNDGFPENRGQFLREWGFGWTWGADWKWKWVDSGGEDAAEAARGREFSYHADSRYTTSWPAMAGGEVRHFTLALRDGRVVVPDTGADLTDALLEAVFGEGRDREWVDNGGVLWIELEDGRRCLFEYLRILTYAPDTVVSARGEGWLFAPAPPPSPAAVPPDA